MYLLNSLDKLAEHLPRDLHGYLDVFYALRSVEKNLFSLAGPPDDYERIIDDFCNAVKRNQINVTPSFHAVLSHVKDFFRLSGTEFGLGLYSEQAGEAVHLNFKSLFDRFRYLPNKTSGERLLAAVAEYNFRHIALIPDNT